MRSMTGYASAIKTKEDRSLHIAIRSLNFKYCDVFVHNLPSESILMEESIKKEVKKVVHRGKVEIFIFPPKTSSKKIFIDEDVVKEYVSKIKKIGKKYSLEDNLTVSDILKLPQTVSWEKRTTEDQSLVVSTLKSALGGLVKFKIKEGKAIEKEISSNLSQIKINIRKATKLKPSLSKANSEKEDIDEELSLILFYIGKLEKKIENKNFIAKGKSIDFLTQEILRELNAASSKSRKKNLSILLVEAKNYLERIREQAQNIE